MPDVKVMNIPLGSSSTVYDVAALSVIVSAPPACAVPVSVVTEDAVIVILPVDALGVIVKFGW